MSINDIDNNFDNDCNKNSDSSESDISLYEIKKWVAKRSISTTISSSKYALNHKNKDSSNTNFSSNYNKSEYEEDKNSLNDKKSSSSNNSESFNKNYQELKLRYEKRISTKKSRRSNTLNEFKFTNSYNINTAEEIKSVINYKRH